MKRLGRLAAIFLIMFKIGLFTFGGGWSIITQIQAEFVEKRGWMRDEEIADYMSLAKSFPGVMIINMSVFCGYSMAGIPGAVAAAFGLSTPALLAIGFVTYFYSELRDNYYVDKVLNGVRSVVVPILAVACIKLWKTAFNGKASIALFLISTVVCCISGFNKLTLIILAGIVGLLVWKGKVS